MLKLNFSEFFEFSRENSYFERIRMVRMVRMVRSLADRTFQLRRSRLGRSGPRGRASRGCRRSTHRTPASRCLSPASKIQRTVTTWNLKTISTLSYFLKLFSKCFLDRKKKISALRRASSLDDQKLWAERRQGIGKDTHEACVVVR